MTRRPNQALAPTAVISMLRLLAISSMIFAVIDLPACKRSFFTAIATPQRHILVGSWKATDGTIFMFRNDGTFHGIDYRSKEIWGNWVTLSEERIGFQSLLHDATYRPQYAVIDKTNTNLMHYIITGGTSFIDASRIPDNDAEKKVQSVIVDQIYSP
jgi:hypothetical protein